MLVLSPERLIPLGSNDITLFKDGYYYYLDRPTYDSCIILSSKFNLEAIGLEIDSQTNKEAVEFFEGFLPHPIRILAPFLGLIESEIELDVEECVKAIHIITNTISLERFIGVPKEIRKSVSFSLSVGDEAELSTNAFLTSALEYDAVISMMRGQHVTQYVQDFSTPNAPSYAVPQPGRQVAVQEPAPLPPVSQGFDYDAFDLDSAGVDELREHPDYVETGPGVFYNEKTDTCAFVDVPEDEAFLERSKELDAIEREARNGVSEEDDVVQPPSSTVTSEEAEGLGSILL